MCVRVCVCATVMLVSSTAAGHCQARLPLKHYFNLQEKKQSAKEEKMTGRRRRRRRNLTAETFSRPDVLTEWLRLRIRSPPSSSASSRRSCNCLAPAGGATRGRSIIVCSVFFCGVGGGVGACFVDRLFPMMPRVALPRSRINHHLFFFFSIFLIFFHFSCFFFYQLAISVAPTPLNSSF